MESQLLTSSLLRRSSAAPVVRINMSAHSGAGSQNGIKIGWAVCLEAGQSSRPVCHQTMGEHWTPTKIPGGRFAWEVRDFWYPISAWN